MFLRWEQTPLLEPCMRQWCQTVMRWTCPVSLQEQSKWVPDLEVRTLLSTWRQRRSSAVAAGQGGKDNVVLTGQDLQIPRQVSPTQSHQSNGTAEKAVSKVRGLARTYLAVIKDNTESFDVTAHAPVLPWTISQERHA